MKKGTDERTPWTKGLTPEEREHERLKIEGYTGSGLSVQEAEKQGKAEKPSKAIEEVKAEIRKQESKWGRRRTASEG